jgi:probable O-glycosylation ligase (exosortase A-associated)
VRDVIVTLLFVVGAFIALKRPYVGGLLWVWIGLMNPHRLGWSFAHGIPFSMLAAGVTFVAIIFNRGQARWLGGGPVYVLLIFLVWMCATTATAIVPDPSQAKLVDVFKVLLMALVVGSLTISRKQIIGLIVVVTGSIAFYGFKGGIFTITTGGAFRVWGPPASLVEGNNELALALVMCIPMLYFLAKEAGQLRLMPLLRRYQEKTLTWGLYAGMFLCAVSAIGSQSRGAFLAVIAMSGMLWIRSRSKLPLLLLFLFCVPFVLMMMPEEWFDRMRTIQTYEEDGSAMGRIIAWKMAIAIANDRIMGAGFATANDIVYSMYASSGGLTLVAHSIYFQVLGDHGYIGLGLYLIFWILTYRCATRLMKMGKRHPELTWVGTLGAMSTVSIVGFAVGGAFLSLAYWDMPYYLMVILLATERHAKEFLAARQGLPIGASHRVAPSAPAHGPLASGAPQ